MAVRIDENIREMIEPLCFEELVYTFGNKLDAYKSIILNRRPSFLSAEDTYLWDEETLKKILNSTNIYNIHSLVSKLHSVASIRNRYSTYKKKTIVSILHILSIVHALEIGIIRHNINMALDMANFTRETTRLLEQYEPDEDFRYY